MQIFGLKHILSAWLATLIVYRDYIIIIFHTINQGGGDSIADASYLWDHCLHSRELTNFCNPPSKFSKCCQTPPPPEVLSKRPPPSKFSKYCQNVTRIASIFNRGVDTA